MADTLLGYKLDPQMAVHFTSCGVNQLNVPVSQARRVKPCFVLYLVRHMRLNCWLMKNRKLLPGLGRPTRVEHILRVDMDLEFPARVIRSC